MTSDQQCPMCGEVAYESYFRAGDTFAHSAACISILLLAPFTEPIARFRKQYPKALPDIPDVALGMYASKVVSQMGGDIGFIAAVQLGIPWLDLRNWLAGRLPEGWPSSDRSKFAYAILPGVMCALFGQQGYGWRSEPIPSTSGKWKRTVWATPVGLFTWQPAAKQSGSRTKKRAPRVSRSTPVSSSSA